MFIDGSPQPRQPSSDKTWASLVVFVAVITEQVNFGVALVVVAPSCVNASHGWPVRSIHLLTAHFRPSNSHKVLLVPLEHVYFVQWPETNILFLESNTFIQ